MMNRTRITGIDEDSILSMICGGMTVFEFQEKYPNKMAREKTLWQMSNEEIDEIIASCGKKKVVLQETIRV